MLKKTIPLMVAIAVGMASAGSLTPAFAQAPKSNQFWWPEMVDLSPLRAHSIESSPMRADFDYAAWLTAAVAPVAASSASNR